MGYYVLRDCLLSFTRISIVVGVLCLGTVLSVFGDVLAEESAVGDLHAVYEIVDVRIEGNRRVDREAIRLQIQNQSGRISSEMVSEDIKRLYKTGFFDQITAFVVQEGEKQFLKFDLVEKPIVHKVFIKGNDEISEDDLSEVFTFGTMRFLDRARVDALIRNASTLYETRGYFDAEFEYSIIPVGENQVDLTLTVSEGERYKISDISFRGLEKVDGDDLADVIQTSEYKWWSSWLFGTGRLNTPMLENDRNLIRQYFFDHGFIDVQIGEPAVEKKEGRIDISFDIVEGTQYHVGQVTSSGELLGKDQDEVLDGIRSEPGEVFSASQIRDDAFTVSEVYTDIGYAYANVVPDTHVSRSDATVDIEFAVDPGEPVTVRQIEIRGNEKTYDHVIRREMKIDEQDLYSSSKVRRSQVLLERLGYFEEVNISSEPTDSKEEVDLNVNVREGATGSFSAGAGFSSSDGVLFNARLSENNLFGTGRRVVLNGDLGSETENIVLTLADPRLNDTYVSGSIDILSTQREFSDFDRGLVGGAVTFGYPMEEVFGEWAQDITGSLKYEYLDIDISDVNPLDAASLVVESEGTSTSSSITPALIRNTINNPLNPTHGSRQSVSLELAGVGGSEEYYLFDARNRLYYPLLKSDYGDLVFGWRTRFGYGDAYDDDFLPLFRRYFPGGINSVRGFENRTLGPKDENGNEYGGAKQLINNLEIIFPIVNSAGLKGVVFYDIGEAFDDDESISIDELREAYGFGLRWTSPLGPIRIEFGFPVDREEGEDSMVTLFSFGAPL